MASLPVSLKSMLVPSKQVNLEFPGASGFTVQLSYLSREALVNIRKKATKVSIKSRAQVEELNDDLFLELYSQAAIKGWAGLKLSTLETLAPVDLTGQDPDAELEFSQENALYLMKASPDFDSWVSGQVTELGNFATSNAKK